MIFYFNNDGPIFLQIAGNIKEAILNKELLPQQQIPSSTEIALLYNINPATILKGMNLLVSEGLIYKKRGLGMFVSDEAYDIVLKKTRELFYENDIKVIINSAKALNLKKNDLIEIIEKRYNNK